MYTCLSNQCTYVPWYVNQHQVILLASHATSPHELLKTSENIRHLEEGQIDNALVNVVADAKTKTIHNHAVTLTSLVALVVRLTATYKRLVSQLAEVLGRQKTISRGQSTAVSDVPRGAFHMVSDLSNI